MKGISFSKDQIDKIGNSIIYMSSKVSDLNKTKILKILFLLEEAAIKKYGYPFFGIDFQIWKLGPVAKDIFIDLSEDSPNLLNGYIKRDDSNPVIFRATREFDDAEFSDNDLDILEKVANFARTQTAASLVAHTHNHNSLWRKSAIQNGVLELLENELLNSTDFTVDFSLLFEDNPSMAQHYEEVKENLEFVKQLKS